MPQLSHSSLSRPCTHIPTAVKYSHTPYVLISVFDTTCALCQAQCMNKKPVHITTREVAERFGVNIATVRRWVNSGIVTPDITTPGGHHRFTEETVAALTAGSHVRSEQRSQVSA